MALVVYRRQPEQTDLLYPTSLLKNLREGVYGPDRKEKKDDKSTPLFQHRKLLWRQMFFILLVRLDSVFVRHSQPVLQVYVSSFAAITL